MIKMIQNNKRGWWVGCAVIAGTLVGISIIGILPGVKKFFERDEFEMVQSFNRLEVGGVFRFSGQLCQQKERWKLERPRFTVYIIGQVDNDCCHDLECSPEAREVLNKGGHLVSTGDFKLGQTMGIPFINTGWDWKLGDSLIIVEDNKGIVRAIFRNAQFSDISAALKRAKI